MKKQVNHNISVDCVVFGFDFEQLNVLLVERKLEEKDSNELIFSDYTLAGNHIYIDENLDQAASRVLFDLTGLENIYLEQFASFCSPDRLKKENDRLWLQHSGRNPNSTIITTAYFSLLNNQNVKLQWKGRNVHWHAINDVKELAFDHKRILDKALEALRRSLLDEPIGFELLPEKFTLSQLQKLYEVVLGTELDKRNFRKKVTRMKYLIPLDEKQTGVAHKPARLYMFSREVYEKTRKEYFSFNV